MKTKFASLIVTALLGLSGACFTASAFADEGKMVGPVTQIKLAPDGKSATVILKDSKTGTPTTLTITDDLTLEKFKDKRIVEGDEIRARWEKDGKNTSKSFKKTAGC